MQDRDAEPRRLGQGRFLELWARGRWEYTVRSEGRGARGAIAVIATTDVAELVLVEQWRASYNRTTIELPAGLVGDDSATSEEPLLDAAQRELEEETGFRARNWRLLCTAASSPGMAREQISVFRATQLTRVAPGGGTPEEGITVHRVRLDALLGWLTVQQANGKPIDIKVWYAVALLAAER